MAVAPIFTGGGTNIKVIEALSFWPFVRDHSARCQKGFDGIDGLHVAGSPEAFIESNGLSFYNHAV